MTLEGGRNSCEVFLRMRDFQETFCPNWKPRSWVPCLLCQLVASHASGVFCMSVCRGQCSATDPGLLSREPD